jgi:hypothetical protein
MRELDIYGASAWRKVGGPGILLPLARPGDVGRRAARDPAVGQLRAPAGDHVLHDPRAPAAWLRLPVRTQDLQPLAGTGGHLAGRRSRPRFGLDRQRHIEPYLASAADAADSRTGTAITPREQRQRILAARNFLTDITAWGWDNAPSRSSSSPATSRSCPGSCRATCPSTPTGGSTPRCASPPISWRPVRCCSSGPAGCGSAGSSTSSSTACTRSPAPARG